MSTIRARTSALTRFFLMVFAVGFAMVVGSALGELVPAPWHPLALAREGGGAPGAVADTVDEATLAEIDRRLGGLVAGSAVAEAGERTVVVFPVQGNIDLGLSAFLERALLEASDADLVVLEINTFGGRVDAAVQMRDQLMDLEVPTVAFVHSRAISAGALIALSCDVIALAPGSSIGAATPVQIKGDEATPVDKKYVSYLRGEFRSTAEANGRDGNVAEAMVDAQVVIDGLVTGEELVTLDVDQALERGMAELRAPTLDAVLSVLHLDRATRRTPEMSWAEHLVRFLTDPVVGGLLMMFGMAGIGIELYHPGVGLPGAVGVVCLSLFFFGHFMTHLAGIEEIVLIGIGVLLMAIEIFVVPGFGAAGIAGIAFLALGLLLALLGLDLDVSLETGALWMALLRVGSSLGLAAMVFLGFLYLFPQSRLGSRFVLQTRVGEGSAGPGPSSDDDGESALTGRVGTALGDLRPAGFIDVDGRRVDVITEGAYVTKGTRVVVLEARGHRVVVRPVDDETPPDGGHGTTARDPDDDDA